MRRVNPSRPLLRGVFASETERLSFLTRDVRIEVFAEERGLSHLVPILQSELDQELARVRCFSEVAQVLGRLRAAGKRIVVCSNFAQLYGKIVRQLSLSLDGYVMSCEVGAAKPDPVIYHAVCDAQYCRHSDALFIGDS